MQSFLNYLMLGTPAAPLRKALESSGLGEVSRKCRWIIDAFRKQLR